MVDMNCADNDGRIALTGSTVNKNSRSRVQCIEYAAYCPWLVNNNDTDHESHACGCLKQNLLPTPSCFTGQDRSSSASRLMLSEYIPSTNGVSIRSTLDLHG